jgi:hypothetical protein
MRIIKIYSSLFWLLFALVMGYQASLLPMGEMREPGAGFFPLFIALVTGLLAILALIGAWKTKPEPAPEKPRPDEPFRWWNLAIIIAALTAYALTLSTVGFLLSTFWFMLLLVKVVEPQTWTRSLTAALITAVASELFFNVLLNAQIPRGVLGF